MNVDPWKLTWNLVGWTGQVVFFSRFVVQWYATEKKKQVVVPTMFWWLSIIGSLLLLKKCFERHRIRLFRQVAAHQRGQSADSVPPRRSRERQTLLPL